MVFVHFPNILQSYHKDDIFNADETGLYFRGLPDKGHCVKGGELLGGKKAKERITALLCANMSGTEKRRLFIIGKRRLRPSPGLLDAAPELLVLVLEVLQLESMA